MIARIFVYLILFITLPDLYLDRRMLRRHTRYLWWQRVLWWLPGAFMFVYTIILATQRDFAPRSMLVLDIYLLLLGVMVAPKFVYAACSFLGWAHCRFWRQRNNWGNLVGFVLALAVVGTVVYGGTAGFNRLEVRHVEFASPDLPEAFDGYKIVHFSDLHAGTYGASHASVLRRGIDSINAQGADIVAFTGDLQNMEPRELRPFAALLSGIRARDGIFSVLGNHDYAAYIDATDDVKAANERELQEMERSFGWELLNNTNRVIRRGGDSIVVAGMENDGRPPHPQRGDISRALAGTRAGAFVVMLEHDPSAWRRVILPKSGAQLTLSGHTHAGQLEAFGWSPAALSYDEWGGLYYVGRRAIHVSRGMGGFIPFRLGAWNEVTVITLKARH